MLAETNQMTSAAIESRIHRIFLEDLNLEVDVDTDVVESGVLDSLSFVRLLLELENAFGLTMDVSELELEDFSSVRRISLMVQGDRAPGEA